MSTVLNDQSIYRLLLLDIETVPIVPRLNDLPDVTRSLWSARISKTMPENTDPADAWRSRAGIMAEFAKIICISTGYFYKDDSGNTCLRLKNLLSDDEPLLLQQFCELVTKYQAVNHSFLFAGHNIKEFDIPFLCRRMMINFMQLPACMQINGAKPWEVNMLDTLQWWKFGDYKNYISLNLLAHVLGVPSPKTDMDGSMVQDVYYVDKDLERISAYCQKDVEALANVILRFANMPILKDENIHAD
ncbi:MAG: 3-5 exonuclease [Chitinophagaceae bacterium]|nr:3-5 exonuclease [Chitinophagaceae bacterium]